VQKVFIVSLFLFLISSSLMSHQRSESYSKVNIDNTEDTTQVDVEFSIQTSILQRLKKNFPKDWEQDLIQEIINNYQVKGDCKLFVDSGFRRGTDVIKRLL